VTVTLNAVPAVALAGAVTASVEAPAGETAIVPLVPVIEPVTVSVAVTVRLPDWVSVTPLVNVCIPLSPPMNV
jgi:hypothetical protein